MKKILLITIISVGCNLLLAQTVFAVGVGIKPKEINVDVSIGEGSAVEILVTNSGEEPAVYQVYPDNYERKITISPADFRLDARASQIVKIVIKSWMPGEFNTNLSVVGRPVDNQELTVGSGVKVPINIKVQNLSKWQMVFGGIIIICLLILFMIIFKKDKGKAVKILAKIIIIIAIFLIGFLIGREYVIAPTVSPDKNEAVEQSEEDGVSLIIDFGDGEIQDFSSIKIEDGISAFELLKKITTESGIELKYKDYGGELGVMVEVIGGVEDSLADEKFWQYWVNGQYAKIGASNYELKDGDVVEWKYIKGQL